MPPTADSDFGLYVHLPWCVSKCPYCDFNSHALKTPELPEAAYVDALVRDLAKEAQLARDQGWHRPFDTVFFGGGTPSLFSAAAIGRILDAAHAGFGLNPGAEITLEANPGTVERTSFPGLAAAGVNRVSLGAQSFDDDRLKALGRVHRAADTADAVEEIRRGGIDNINIDVMYALPGQSVDGALADLDAALALNPSHLSHYQLTLEPNTLFHHDPPELPDDDTAWTIHERSLERLAAAGFAQYEVSAYAHGGQTARHNLNYWRFGDYVGIGAGAHGKLTLADGRVERTAKVRHPRDYQAAFGPDGQPDRHARRPTPADLAFEYPLNHLRLKDAQLDLVHFEAATGLPAGTLAEPLAAACARGLMAHSGGERYATTALGWRFLNDLQGLFLPAQDIAAAHPNAS